MRGGSETYYFALKDALERKGHEVVCFAMQDEKNLPCEQEKFFVKNSDYNGDSGVSAKLRMVKDFFYNKSAAEQMEALIEQEQPDIAHIGLLHRQITFSVVEVLKKHNIPVVMTMHDLIFACPNYTCLSGGEICESCIRGSVFNCITNKCVKDSYPKSVLAAFEKIYLLKKDFYDYIDLYITECDFYKKLFEDSNVTISDIKTMTNFLPVEQKFEFNSAYSDYVLYFGRFSYEKGILTLLKAHKESGCRYPLKVVGAGPIEDEIKKFVSDNELTNIELPGPIYGDEMERIIEGARVIVVPSEWYENCPYALLQAIAKGKIVIASNIGGLPELISDGETGFLFEAGNSSDLAAKIEQVCTMDKSQYEDMSRHIAESAHSRHNWEQYIDSLLDEYTRLLDR